MSLEQPKTLDIGDENSIQNIICGTPGLTEDREVGCEALFLVCVKREELHSSDEH